MKIISRLWQVRCKIESLPNIGVQASPNFYKAFTAPNPDFDATIHNAAGDQVGTATYALSPLSDRIYIFDIQIALEHRRCGYGTALLWHLARAYGQPITAVKELYSASSFWSAARQRKGDGLVVTEPLSVSEMDVEAARWEHLRPAAERLERLIAERLTVHHEPWHVAVGRGLGAAEPASH
ncbi:GNAT family N-acetyltransferase [Ralstonia pseudosolanacearum]